MADEELDELYGVRPEEFTALRARLVAAAKKRGDAEAARRICAARRPTTAAWVVNLLIQRNRDVKGSLTDLGERLRAAHAAMDGAEIRQLSSEQRSLVDELARAAFEGADVTAPSAAVREDVIATLQAAIADPDVAVRLGRLSKAEQWSGFGGFGDSAPVSAAARSVKPGAGDGQSGQPAARDERRPEDADAELRKAKAALADAERAKDIADGEVSKNQNDLAIARLRLSEMRQRLEDAEHAVRLADEAYLTAKQASRQAADAVKSASARLKHSRRPR